MYSSKLSDFGGNLEPITANSHPRLKPDDDANAIELLKEG